MASLQAAVEIIELYRQMKGEGSTKKEFLLEAARRFSFVYVPQFYELDEAGSLRAKVDGLPTEFENAVVKDFENTPIPEKPMIRVHK